MFRPRARLALAGVLIAAAIPCLTLVGAPFLSWDDQRNIAANPYYLHVGWWRLWTEPYFGLYVPVTSTVWAAVGWLGRWASGPFRVLNVALHGVNTFLVWRLIDDLLQTVTATNERRRRLAAVIGAAVFAVHPLQVDTVGWLSAGRDLLATGFGIGAWLSFRRSSRSSYTTATLLFAAGVLSKPSIAALPLAIVAFAALYEREHIQSVARAMSLWIVLVGIDAAGTSVMQSAMAPVHSPLLRRPLVALDAAGFYLVKLVWPVRLSVDYGRTPDWLAAHSSALVASLAALAVLGGAIAFSRARRRIGGPLLLALILLLPVLGLVPFAFQRISTVADHYLYLPMAMIGLCTAVVVSSYARRPEREMVVLGVLLVAGVTTSLARARAWRNDEALFSDALTTNPRSFVALTNLGRLACERGSITRGLYLLGEAVQEQPGEAVAVADKAYCLYHGGAYDEVVEMRGTIQDPALRFSLDHNADAASSFANTLAGAYFERRQPQTGWLFLCQALALAPYDTALQQNALDVRQMFAEQGVTARCPAEQSWQSLAAQP